MDTTKPEIGNAVLNDNEKDVTHDSKPDVQKDSGDKKDLTNQDEMTEKLESNDDEEKESKKEEEDEDGPYDDDYRCYDYYPQYSYDEEIYNFIHGTPDEQIVEEDIENNHNWMGD